MILSFTGRKDYYINIFQTTYVKAFIRIKRKLYVIIAIGYLSYKSLE